MVSRLCIPNMQETGRISAWQALCPCVIINREPTIYTAPQPVTGTDQLKRKVINKVSSGHASVTENLTAHKNYPMPPGQNSPETCSYFILRGFQR